MLSAASRHDHHVGTETGCEAQPRDPFEPTCPARLEDPIGAQRVPQHPETDAVCAFELESAVLQELTKTSEGEVAAFAVPPKPEKPVVDRARIAMVVDDQVPARHDEVVKRPDRRRPERGLRIAEKAKGGHEVERIASLEALLRAFAERLEIQDAVDVFLPDLLPARAFDLV